MTILDFKELVGFKKFKVLNTQGEGVSLSVVPDDTIVKSINVQDGMYVVKADLDCRGESEHIITISDFSPLCEQLPSFVDGKDEAYYDTTPNDVIESISIGLDNNILVYTYNSCNC